MGKKWQRKFGREFDLLIYFIIVFPYYKMALLYYEIMNILALIRMPLKVMASYCSSVCRQLNGEGASTCEREFQCR